MVFNDGRISSVFRKILSRIRWGGDLVPDTDNSQSIGSPTIGIEELHIATDFLIKQNDANSLKLRNSADTLYKRWYCSHLVIDGDAALQTNGTAILFGAENKPPRIVNVTTVQKLALTETQGMIVFDTDLDRLEHVKDGTNWEALSPTKEKFWGIHAEDTEVDYAVHSLVGALQDNFTGIFPHDMEAILEMVLVLIPKQDDVILSWTTVNAANTEVANTHVDAGNINVNIPGITDKIHEIDISAEFATATKSDYFGAEITGNAGDTYKILGIRLRYR